MTRPACITLLVLTALVMTSVMPGGAAQPLTGQRVDSCRPTDCDPVQANGGIVRTEGPVRVIAYAHLRDLIQLSRLDSHFPKDEVDVNEGMTTPTIITSSGTAGDVRFRNNRFAMVSAAPVTPFASSQLDVVRPAGAPYTVMLAGQTLTGFWYLSPNAVPGPTAAGDPPAAAAMPAVGVRMRMETGHFSDRGTLLAYGDTGLGHGDPDATKAGQTATLISLPDGDYVWEFAVPMTIASVEMPAEKGFIVTVEVYQVAVGPVESTQSAWRVRSGPTFPPRLVMDVVNPLESLGGEVVQTRNDLLLRWKLAGMWGAFDLDFGSIDLVIDGPTQVPGEMIRFEKFQFDGSRSGSMVPVEAQWRVPLKEARLLDGVYTVTSSATNHQGTYRLHWTQVFEVAGGDPLVAQEGDAPGAAAPAALAVLAAAAFIRRRRL